MLRRAYDTLFECCGPLIFSYLRAHISSPEEAEDLTLDVFVVALEQDDLLTWNETRQLAWLRGVARNKLLESYRRKKRSSVVVAGQMVSPVLDVEKEPEQMVLLNEAHAQLHTQIRQLSASQQQLLLLRYGQGLPTLEIARLLDKSDQAIRKQLSRTLSLLRSMQASHAIETEEEDG